MTMLQMGDADKEYNKFILKTTPNKKIDQLFLIVVKYKPKNLFKDCLESIQVFFPWSIISISNLFHRITKLTCLGNQCIYIISKLQ